MTLLGADQSGVGEGTKETRQANIYHGILKGNVLKKGRKVHFLQIAYFRKLEQHRNHQSAWVIEFVSKNAII